MTQKPTPAEVDEYLDNTVLDDDPVLSAALKDSDAAGLPKIAVSAQQGKFLSAWTRDSKSLTRLTITRGSNTNWVQAWC